MKEITREMIREFKLKQLGYDFCGYVFKNANQLSFHHLIVPLRDCKSYGLGEGYVFWNGAILNQSTSHDYLHAIERIDPEIFAYITSEMIDENAMRAIKIANLRRIRSALLSFEAEHCSDRTKGGAYVIKPIFVEKRIKL